ncbi:1-deoxy-D-xylulose-5-phosphate synthase [candidate division KSB1 bacterium]
MSLLENINTPADIRDFTVEELVELAKEIRDYIINTIPEIGGHFASSLGVVELTLALHYVYDTPNDKITWDVGHQGYVHKILTGRKEALKNIRQYEGISGFLNRNESPYDVFGAGHASTSISSALGFAKARDLMGKDYRVVAVIGDGGITGGLAYEGLNNAGGSNTDITVILNDNHMSISRNVGAISRYLVSIVTNPFYQKLRAKIWELTGKMPKSDTIRLLAHKIEEGFKSLVIPGMLFEDLGFRYYGPIDGHNVGEVVNVLKNIKDLPGNHIVHLLTTKGKGCEYAEDDPIKYHGIKGIDKKPEKKHTVKPVSYTEVFGKAMCNIAETDNRVSAITAAMKEGTGLVEFADKYPDRFFDVGIAEGHAVTFAAGLAAEGIKPVVAVYSSFLQRAFDHIIHDVSLQKLPVVFALDRAGLVGEDGPTHHGTFDLSYLNSIPGMIVSAPKDGTEFMNLLYTGINYGSGPFAIRYPRDIVPVMDWDSPFKNIELGTWEQIREGNDVLILAVGTMIDPSLTASELLEKHGVKSGVVNARFIKPLDKAYLRENLKQYDFVVTIEENIITGGFGDGISQYFINNDLPLNKLLRLGLPDKFITHGSRNILLELVELTPEKIAQKIKDFISKKHSNFLKQLF